MKYTIFAILSLTGMTSLAQKNVVIKGRTTGLPDGSKIWIIPGGDSGTKDSALVKNGRFQFSVPLREPNPHYDLRLSREWLPHRWMTLCLEAGTMHIDIKDDFRHCRLSGGSLANDQDNYLQFLHDRGYYRQDAAVKALERKAAGSKDTALINHSHNVSRRLFDLRADLTLQWIALHPNSMVSSFFLEVPCGHLPLSTREPVFDKLTPSAKNNAYGRSLQQAIDSEKATGIGKTAPDFSQADTLGKTVSLQDLRGKYILIDFWASWCVPCRAEHPALIAAYKKYKDKGFEIVGVSLDKQRAEWVEAIRKDRLPWTQVSDLKSWKNAIAVQYNIHSVPANYLLDPQGKIIARNLRGDRLEKELAALLD